ncbi:MULTISPECIES: Lrp/AsnC family transcriptional regulator [Pseudomonas syringae group]|uniref:AsnC family transcriptional regulator n=4 Tax=Pseudomonas syringae group TaxID=136849 RepID=F3GHM3_PSESJ|nr:MULTISPECIES: Lrp/AsnC family transcriptional regulator [Pseudomonas syringae group]EGH46576.1 AsnC family transcriptional regulator [Pseudomonas syringae pv. pisi str. 1704B]RMU79395.1 putative AsnC-family regulatory protein [Pseudomonas syringae pv. aptata]AZG85705.1 Lrp/AsnC family transcriptional regulator [Pseudomonas syringae pv. pisi str. PP1]PYD09208.1 Lrp/AsnC family transcriptional regulator [Pseudomonas syringae pv. pisi]PYD25614.1 Lrp/AsnC family transcriptional regulator [Pseud
MKRLLDPQDEAILAELTANAKISHAELGSRVNLSRNAVRQRIERLERDGAIQGYTIRLGEGRKGSAPISAIIFVYRYDRMRGDDVVKAIKAIPEVTMCEVMSGEFDLMVRIEASHPERVHLVWKMTAAMPGVENTVTTFVLNKLI